MGAMSLCPCAWESASCIVAGLEAHDGAPEGWEIARFLRHPPRCALTASGAARARRSRGPAGATRLRETARLTYLPRCALTGGGRPPAVCPDRGMP